MTEEIDPVTNLPPVYTTELAGVGDGESEQHMGSIFPELGPEGSAKPSIRMELDSTEVHEMEATELVVHEKE